ncbi:hypothetical protein BXY70_0628 [Roseovarius halotolerans]|uniref:Periplasmic protein n=1 Tax=Roseovarius halotolerans TaxID=505353 RepID=A0A1X6YGZ3_9RHOB|nr:hypothetical protein [Roseovarius halotolerans]RKT34610.1 hypothetical protein BXY70_0628 [Roseovarius halotolerans]SLN21423.1 hypothetical protein ROH8110_00767 [Roseovarius halotolerans]
MKYLAKGIILTCIAALPNFGHAASGQDKSHVPGCECTIFPFKPHPPCANKCSAKFIQEVSAMELEAKLGIDKELQSKILTFQMNANYWATMDEFFTTSDQSDLMKALENADREWLQEKLKQVFEE